MVGTRDAVGGLLLQSGRNPDTLPPMSDGTLVNVDADTGAGIVLTTVKCEKVGARESQIIESEVRAKAPSR